MKKTVIWLVFALAMMMAWVGAFAEEAGRQMPVMTEGQIQAMEEARAALEKAEDEILPQLVEAGALSRQDLDDYLARRNAMGGGRMDGDRTPPEGFTPPEDGAMPENMTPPEGGTRPEGGMGGNSILEKIDVSKAPQELIDQLQGAQDAYQAALQVAGISMGNR